MRWLRNLILGLMVIGFLTVVAFGALYIATGGEIITGIRTAVLRASLANRQAELNTPLSSDSTPRRFTISAGESPIVIGRNLAASGLIGDAGLFLDYVRAEGLDTQIQAGTYFLNPAQTIPTIAQTIIDSRNASITFQILEGMRLEEIAAQIDATPLFGFSGADFLAVVDTGASIDPAFAAQMGIPTGASLEGFLFPDTYILPPELDALGLRDTLLEAFRAQTGAELVTAAAAEGFTMRDAVTLASILEREAVWNDEHPMIASVYRNRLSIGMLLQADPTVQYALDGARGAWWPRITQADYQAVVSPFNTYLNAGLPPSPIANPGISAIRAAIFPAESTYYYFRARCDGSNYHNFATTYEEHLAFGC